MRQLKEALIKKSNIKIINAPRVYNHYKKSNLKNGDLIKINNGEVGIAIKGESWPAMDEFVIAFEKSDTYVLFPTTENKEFSYIRMSLYNEDLSPKSTHERAIKIEKVGVGIFPKSLLTFNDEMIEAIYNWFNDPKNYKMMQ